MTNEAAPTPCPKADKRRHGRGQRGHVWPRHHHRLAGDTPEEVLLVGGPLDGHLHQLEERGLGKPASIGLPVECPINGMAWYDLHPASGSYRFSHLEPLPDGP